MQIPKGQGVTPTEKTLAKLCERAFLPLWSFPNVYRAPGKELCDLLAVSGSNIFIFGDKEIPLKLPGIVGSDGSMSAMPLNRWMQNAVFKSAKQLWGAEKHVRNHPDKIFCDSAAKTPLRISCDTREASIHLVLVANGASRSMAEFWRGIKNPTLALNSELRGKDAHIIKDRVFPVGGAEHPLMSGAFQVGDLDPDKPFIHVFDETGIRTVIEANDTGTDMVGYFTKRKVIFRDGRVNFIAPDEESLLFEYSQYGDSALTRDFRFHREAKPPLSPPLVLDEARSYPRIQEEFTRKKQADKISYRWDELTVHIVKKAGNMSARELRARALAIMASEPRFIRRTLGETLEKLSKIPKGTRVMRILHGDTQEAVYVFLGSEVDNENTMGDIITAACVLALTDQSPHSRMAIGIFMTPKHMLVQCEHKDKLTSDSVKIARRIDEKHRLFKSVKKLLRLEKEVPDD